ncbi:hypothetical protein [Rufibacter psychrotolerans]|uniref:hypothetical protein n=1 Tax=Rufibacter psychrotolerans TaxID=2812556 RepID=UPI001967FB8C|nr:hypothetical protein [Rufibacter sp. SYSU D00308]
MNVTDHVTNERAMQTTPEPSAPRTSKYLVVKGNILLKGFSSFYEAYMHALNKFCSEDFLVMKEDEL